VHYLNSCRPPVLFFDNQNPSNLSIISHCPSLRRPYYPTFWALNKHVSTLVSMFRTKPHVDFEREEIMFSDGGSLCLDWVESVPHCQTDKPTLLILHGLNGGSDASYVRHLILYAKAKNPDLQIVVMNNRGVAGSVLRTPKGYCGAYTDDVREVVQHVRNKIGKNSTLIAVGYSLGANILVKYIGEEGSKCLLNGAISCSNPFDFNASAEVLNKRTLYNKVLTQGCIENYGKQEHVFKDCEHIDSNHVKMSNRLWDFDDRFTRKIFGYDSVEAYYNDASSDQYLPNVKIPLLILHAYDDPIVNKYCLPTKEAMDNPFIIFAMVQHGGHVSFPQGCMPFFQNGSWSESVITQYLTAIHSISVRSTSPKL